MIEQFWLRPSVWSSFYHLDGNTSLSHARNCSPQTLHLLTYLSKWSSGHLHNGHSLVWLTLLSTALFQKHCWSSLCVSTPELKLPIPLHWSGLYTGTHLSQNTSKTMSFNIHHCPNRRSDACSAMHCRFRMGFYFLVGMWYSFSSKHFAHNKGTKMFSFVFILNLHAKTILSSKRCKFILIGFV